MSITPFPLPQRCLALLGLFLMGVPWAQSPAPKLPAVAIMPFRGDQTVTPEQLEFITGQFQSELIATRQFTVLDRGRMDFILKEQGFQQSGVCSSSECQVQMGQLLGVDRLVAGQLVRFGSRYAFRAEYIDVGSGEIRHTVEHTETGALEDVFQALCRVTALRLAQVVAGGEPAAPPAPVSPAPDAAALAAAVAAPPVVAPEVAAPQALPSAPASKKGLSLKRKIGIGLLALSAGAVGLTVAWDVEVQDYNEAFLQAKQEFTRNPNEETAQRWRNANENAGNADIDRDIAAGTSIGLGVLGLLLLIWPEGGNS